MVLFGVPSLSEICYALGFGAVGPNKMPSDDEGSRAPCDRNNVRCVCMMGDRQT